MKPEPPEKYALTKVILLFWFFLKSLRLWKAGYLKYLMAHSHAHTKLDFDPQIHNLLTRLYFWHDELMMRSKSNQYKSTEDTESLTDCWGWLFFSPPLSPTDREDQSILCTCVYKLRPALHEFYFIFRISYKHILCFIETIVIAAY